MNRKGKRKFATLASRLPLTSDDTRRGSTYPGMASWGGEGPPGKTCRECDYWCHTGYLATGEIKKGMCAKALDMGGLSGPKVPDYASACKYFIPSIISLPAYKEPK